MLFLPLNCMNVEFSELFFFLSVLAYTLLSRQLQIPLAVFYHPTQQKDFVAYEYSESLECNSNIIIIAMRFHWPFLFWDQVEQC